MKISLATQAKPTSSFSVDNGRSMWFTGDRNVKYTDIVAGDEGITMMVHILGGRNARVECPFLIFQNEVCYRSQTKGWMDGDTFVKWLSEKGRSRRIYMEENGCCTLTTVRVTIRILEQRLP